MKRALVCTVIFACVALMAAGSAFAGTQSNVKIALYAMAVPAKNACSTNAPSNLACDSVGGTSNLVVQAPTNAAQDVYLVALDVATGPGLGGVSLGLSYSPTIAIFGAWNKCADQDFAGNGWPADGGGDAITYATCAGQTPDPSDPQGDGAVVLGYITYLYAYGDGVMAVTPRNFITPPDFKAADCAAAESNLPAANAGTIGFGAATGYQPCLPAAVPVQNSTWGGVKSQFSGE